MSPQPATTNAPPLEEAAKRARELNEQIIDAARKAGEAHFNAYEAWLKGIAEQQRKFAEAAAPGGAPADMIVTLLKAQAEFNKQIADSFMKPAKK